MFVVGTPRPRVLGGNLFPLGDAVGVVFGSIDVERPDAGALAHRHADQVFLSGPPSANLRLVARCLVEAACPWNARLVFVGRIWIAFRDRPLAIDTDRKNRKAMGAIGQRRIEHSPGLPIGVDRLPHCRMQQSCLAVGDFTASSLRGGLCFLCIFCRKAASICRQRSPPSLGAAIPGAHPCLSHGSRRYRCARWHAALDECVDLIFPPAIFVQQFVRRRQALLFNEPGHACRVTVQFDSDTQHANTAALVRVHVKPLSVGLL